MTRADYVRLRAEIHSWQRVLRGVIEYQSMADSRLVVQIEADAETRRSIQRRIEAITMQLPYCGAADGDMMHQVGTVWAAMLKQAERDVPAPPRAEARATASLATLSALSDRASERWAVSPSPMARGAIVGGPDYAFSNGVGQTQIASFTVPRLADDDSRDSGEVQAANTAFALACVTFVRTLIARSGHVSR